MGVCIDTIFGCCLSKKQRPMSTQSNREELLTNSSIDTNNNSPLLTPNKPSEQSVSHSDNSLELCFDDEWLRDEERGLVQYTKERIMQLINDEFVSDEGYEELHNKDGMILSTKSTGSLFNAKFILIRMSYTIPLSHFPPNMTLEDFWSYISVPEKRLRWDKGLKEYLILKGTDERGVIYKWMNRPIALISERDSVEKMICFSCPKGDLYAYLSSVNDEFNPIKEKVARITDWMSGYRFSKDGEQLYIHYLSQIDLKMTTPQFVLQLTMPPKLKEWYTSMKNQINEDSRVDKDRSINKVELTP